MSAEERAAKAEAKVKELERKLALLEQRDENNNERAKRQKLQINSIPIGVLTDSYKTSHFLMYPEAKKIVAYGEFRSPFEGRKDDQRLIFYGIR